MPQIYLDHNASTPIAPSVAEAMWAAMGNTFGNPSSPHWAGVPAKRILADARTKVAELIGAHAHEIVFTSGGSEANNHALKGVAHASARATPHIITTAVEHPAIHAPCNFLERRGARITRLTVDSAGRIDPEDLRRAVTPDTVLMSIMTANNEVGTIQPVAECARIAREHGIWVHTDAAQAIGKIPVNVDELDVDLLSLAGHKFYAPKGVGALYVRDGIQLEPLIHGAGHERGRRAGTESALLAAALGEASKLAGDLRPMGAVQALRDDFWQALQARFGDAVVLNGHPEYRLPNTLNVAFVGHDGGTILNALDGVAASTGSACHAESVELSPVLAAMDVPERVGMGAIRFSLGRETTRAEIETVLANLDQLEILKTG